MAHAYTPGLRVAETTIIRKERRLPLPGDVIVEQGAKVAAEAVVAQTFLPGDVQSLNIANKLGLLPSEVASCMKREKGEEIEKGDIIAETKGLFGLFKGQVRSPIKGTIDNISSVTGQVLLREPPMPVSVKAYLDGVVAEVIEGEGVVMEAVGSLIQGIFGIGGETTGELIQGVESANDVLDEKCITPDMKDRIVIGGALVTYEGLKKAIAMGVRAVVVGGFDDADLRRFLGFDLGVAITGSEQLGVTLVVTEGFGRIRMAGRSWELLTKNVGRKASVNGATQIRAGVIRPEVIIIQDIDPSTVPEVNLAESGGLDVGTDIRGIREPYFGLIGKVTAMPTELMQVESETWVRVLEASFDNGERVVLPRANVEAIEK